MSDLEVEDYVETDSSDNEEQYAKLRSSISQLDSTQKVKPASRKEISSEVSEYNLTKGASTNLVNVKDLAKVLGKKPAHVSITKKFNKVTNKSQTLPKPLEAPVEEKLKRSIGFENVKKQLGRWDAIVTRQSLMSHLSFPLNNTSMKMQPSKDFLKKFKNSTPLEMEISEVLNQNNQPDKEDEIKEFPLTLEEMLERRKEMAHLRAKLSYKESKAQRQSKIKSKKYHRILKREKLRQQLKEFEALQKTDPEAALKKLAELDKSRALERASLRHRNTGQWAKNLTVRAKYDIESRKVLAEQLKMSREITQKVHMPDSSDNETDKVIQALQTPSNNQDLNISKDNPWALDVSEEITSFVSSYKKYWDEKNKEINQKKLATEPNSSDVGVDREVGIKDSLKEASFNQEEKQEKNLSNENTQRELGIKKVSKHSKNVSNGNSSVQSSGKAKQKKNIPVVNIHNTSGVWIVTPVTGEPEINDKIKNKRKFDDIDDLFGDLSDKLQKNAMQKVKKIKSKLEKNERRRKNKLKKKEESKEFDLSMKNVGVIERPDIDNELSEGVGKETDVPSTIVSNGVGSTSSAPVEIDPKNFIQIKPKRLNSCLPENITGGDEALDDEEIQLKAIEEAFGDDDVIAEFKELKEEESNTKVEIQTSLPGWGEWAGAGIKPSQRKKRPLVINLPPRKDTKKDDIIINENENPNIRNHLVKEVPHPFKSVQAFEANIRMPVGRDWMPETAHRRLIRKNVETKLGTVINPMDEDELIKFKKTPKSPYQGKKKRQT